MDKRTLFYWSKLYTEQLSEGQAFNELKKTITINILDFNILTLKTIIVYSIFGKIVVKIISLPMYLK